MTGEMQKCLKLVHAGMRENKAEVEVVLRGLKQKEDAVGLDEAERELVTEVANIFQHILFTDFLVALHEDVTRLTTETAALKGQVAKLQEERG